MEITKKFLMKAMKERLFLKARSGEKVLISYYDQKSENYPFIGYVINKNNDILHESWNHQGITYINSNKPNPRDIVGVWKESYVFNGIDLPEAPLSLKDVKVGDTYYIASLQHEAVLNIKYGERKHHKIILNNHLLFETFEGAKAFLDALLSSIKTNYNNYYNE